MQKILKTTLKNAKYHAKKAKSPPLNTDVSVMPTNMVTGVSSVNNTAEHLESFSPQVLVKHQEQQWVHKGVNKANVK